MNNLGEIECFFIVCQIHQSPALKWKFYADEDDDELLLWNGWQAKGVKPYFQVRPLSEILTITNLQLATKLRVKLSWNSTRNLAAFIILYNENVLNP